MGACATTFNSPSSASTGAKWFFSPIAGHVRDRYAIQYLAQLRDIELWLAPITGTRVMVPFRVALPTPLGLGVLQATQFISMPQPGKATARTQ